MLIHVMYHPLSPLDGASASGVAGLRIEFFFFGNEADPLRRCKKADWRCSVRLYELVNRAVRAAMSSDTAPVSLNRK